MARPGFEPEASPEGERATRFEPGRAVGGETRIRTRGEPGGRASAPVRPRASRGWRDPDSNRAPECHRRLTRVPVVPAVPALGRSGAFRRSSRYQSGTTTALTRT